MPVFTRSCLRTALSIFICASCLTPLTAQNITAPWITETWDANPQVTALQEHKGRVFVGTVNAGLFYSDNNGDSWTNLRDKIPMRRIDNLLATESALYAYGPADIYRSTDKGDSWASSQDISGMALPGVKDMTQLGSSLYVVNSVSFYRSEDEGNTWVKVQTTGGLHSVSIDRMEAHNDKLYVTSSKSAFTLDIPSSTLQEIEIPLNNNSISMLKSVGGQIYIAGYNSGSNSPFFRRNKAGDGWQSIDNVFPPTTSVFDMHVSKGIFYIATTHGVFSSPDALSWNSVPNSLAQTYYECLTFSDGFMLAGTKCCGVHRYNIADPGSENELVNTDLHSWSPSRIWRTSERLIVESPGIGTRDKRDNTDDKWSDVTVNSSIPMSFAGDILPFNDQWLAAANRLFTSTDGGRTWQLIPPSKETNNVQKLVVANDQVVGFNPIYSVEYAADWSAIRHSLPVSGGFDPVVAQGNTIFGVASDGRLFQSQDLGRSWQEVNTGLPKQEIQHIWANSELLFAVSQTGALQSLDGGVTWAALATQGLDPANPVLDIVSYNRHVYILQQHEIIFSDYGFSKWTKLSLDGLAEDVRLSSMEIYEGQIYVGTYGDGVFKTNLEVVSNVSEAPVNILNLQLSPNPVKQTSTFVYTLYQATQVEIGVYDMLGNTAIAPSKQFRKAGTFSQEINAGGLASGQYTLVISAGDKTVTQQFSVVR